MLFHAIKGWWMLPAAITLLTWAYCKVLVYLPHSLILLATGAAMVVTMFLSWFIYAWWNGWLFWWSWVF